ncbi:MAG: large subunit ribosomal protein [Patescibacteria group bacterium]|nr:large subunit ribosomal protein [Patescibacteria group bacterium]
MRHRMKKFGHFKKKDRDHRDSMIRNLLTSFFLHSSVVTTEKRALAITGMIDKLINVANEENQLNAIREVGSVLFTKESSVLLFERAAKFKDRKSGFSRITPIKYRDGDSAKIVKIELVEA